jgi:putative flippase GtrA
MAHAGPTLDAERTWVPSRKLTAAIITNALTWLVALAVTKLGLHESVAVAAWVSTVIGIVAGAVAGYLVKEIPVLEKDIEVPKAHP